MSDSVSTAGASLGEEDELLEPPFGLLAVGLGLAALSAVFPFVAGGDVIHFVGVCVAISGYVVLLVAKRATTMIYDDPRCVYVGWFTWALHAAILISVFLIAANVFPIALAHAPVRYL